MARALLYLGASGVGKSSSLRTLPPKEVFIIKPNPKELPFPGSEANYKEFDPIKKEGNMMRIDDIADLKPRILALNKAPHIKYIVIEDLSHFYTHRILSTSFVTTVGYEKWNQFGSDVYNAIFSSLNALREDLTIIVIQHTEVKDDGTVGDKTAGKLLVNTIDIPSWFTVVLHGLVVTKGDKTQYVAQTNKAGNYQAKSPAGMFSSLYVRNDMREILDEMNAYYAGTSKNEVEFI